MSPLPRPSLDDIYAAREHLAKFVSRTPLVRFTAGDSPAEIYLKLENLQPGGSFKVRGAGNALLTLDREQAAAGVWTASAGNMGQALAWWARQLEIPCMVVVPENASPIKVEQIAAIGARILPVPFEDYQQIQIDRKYPGLSGQLIHPFADPAVMAGNGTIGLEILADLPDVETVIVPYGGGGLSCGIAAAIKALKPAVKVYAAEVETGAPFTASYAQGCPVEVSYRHSFVNGIGAPFIFPEMWKLASHLLDGSIAVSVTQTANAIRTLAQQNHLIAEGAGAVALAAARAGQVSGGKIACIVSGGNIDTADLIAILHGQVPFRSEQ